MQSWCLILDGVVWRSGMVDETKLQVEIWGISKKPTTIGGCNIGLRTFMVDKTSRKGGTKVRVIRYVKKLDLLRNMKDHYGI